MKSAPVLPFRTAPPECLGTAPWRVAKGESVTVKLTDYPEGWDYNQDLRLSREVSFDAGLIRRQCGLDGEASISLAVVVRSDPARYRECTVREPLVSDGQIETTLTFDVSGDMLSRELAIDTEVVLMTDLPHAPVLTARRAGSRLFQESLSVRLEGQGGRFPTATVDFESALSHLKIPNGLWYLHFNTVDFDAPVLAVAQMLLNSRREEFVGRAVDGDPATVSTLRAAIARQFIAVAIRDREFVEQDGDWREESFGAVTMDLILLCFPGMDLDQIRSLEHERPAVFEAMIQNAVALSNA